MTHESGWKKKSQEDRESIFLFSEGYKAFLDRAKTEREAVRSILQNLSNHGFSGDPAAGKVVQTNRGKEAVAFVKGKQGLDEGCNIIAAHIDAPRLDLKQNPLYEDVGLGLLKTHYYGGIKKYQWVAMPLAIHGTIVKTDGRAIELVIGEEETDPVFSIDDLLPHLSRKTQDEKKLSEAIDGEKLTLLFGSIPVIGEEKEAVTKHILELLSDRYGIVEEDLISAEIEVVPAFKARDVGIDRSMVGAYGQDDRASAYPLLKAISEIETPIRSCLAIFIDKEEIGSEGNTGMK
ncbi:MAG TPA: aminopeptidase, partial [Syntrophorhabdus aromaticivorans]|nr:aminopeptidase [Syntrophorhabdus aromaticivorans]